MARSRWMVLAGAMLAGASGCALCDTCNQVPSPCTGPGCSAALNVGTFPPGGQPIAPPSNASASTPALTAPTLPDIPADPPTPPPPPIPAPAPDAPAPDPAAPKAI